MTVTEKAYKAEMLNLLTEENLNVALKVDRFRMDVSKDVYKAMELREVTLRLRLALPLDDWQMDRLLKAESLLDRVLQNSRTNGKSVYSVTVTGNVDEREHRYNLLSSRLSDALRWTKWGRKLEKDAEREERETKRSAYAELTGDRDFLWYQGV